MSAYKISGCCTLCDEPCFEVIARWGADERRAGEPKRLGPPLDGSIRVTFMLNDGSRSDMTFCGRCAEDLNPAYYTAIWQKVMRSWKRELDDKPEAERNPDWFQKQFSNGLLCELKREDWKELAANG